MTGRGFQKVPVFGANGLLLLTLFCALVPLSPHLPGPGLDESWQLGINQAIAQGASLGTDLVFTFGPYACIHTKVYHPATDALMLWSSAYLALSYAIACMVATRGRPWGWTVAILLVIAGLLPYPSDTLLFSYPLIAALAGARLVGTGESDRPADRKALWWLVLLWVPFGLLPLVKGTVLILCGVVTLICSIHFALQGRRWATALCLVVPVISGTVFWVLSGQSLNGLPGYFANMAPIASGYTEAMAISGRSSETWAYLICSALLLGAIAFERSLPVQFKWFLLVLFAVFLFMVFKGSYVRHDGRVVGGGASLVLATLLMLVASRTRWAGFLCLVAVISWWGITRHYASPREMVPHFFAATYREAWSGLNKRLREPDWPRRDFDAALATIRMKAGIPPVAGSVDIYSHGQSALIASGNRWNFRPVLQSYSAYLPALAEMNLQHLLGANAPDHLIFRLEPIDQRFPSLDDGPSWPAILGRYQPSRLVDDQLFLERRSRFAADASLVRGPVQVHALGERVPVPADTGPHYAEVNIRPNWLGSLANTFYKPSRLEIDVELQDGSQRRYRLIAGMARSAFMISPLIESTAEFALLFGQGSHLSAKQVKSFSVSAADRGLRMWKESYQVGFSRLTPAPEAVSTENLQLFDRVVEDESTQHATVAASCDGNIDVVNGVSPAPKSFSAGTSLRLLGWAATSTSPAVLPDAVLLVLTDEAGKRRFVQARRTPRPDVGAYFKSATLDDSGFAATIDLTAISGRHTLGLAQKRAGKIVLCPAPKIAVEVHAATRTGP